MAEPEHFAAIVARHYPQLQETPMPTQARKRRGRQTEHLVAQAFAADGWPHALPTGAGSPGRDITGTPGIAVEVKARTRFEPVAALRQATTNAGNDIPVVVLRPNGQGPTTIDNWPAFIPFGLLRTLLRQAGYGTPTEPPETALNGPQDDEHTAAEGEGTPR